MRKGGSKAKGALFERAIAKQISLWLSGGKRADLLWRSSMSGGRATVSKDKLSAVAGDICATSAEGDEFISKWFIEAKHVKDLRLVTYLLKGTGPIAKWWIKAQQQSIRYKKMPMLILKGNGMDTLVMTRRRWIMEDWSKVNPLLILKPIQSQEGDLALYYFSDLFPQPAVRPHITRKSK
jgi:hypothetical protein